MTRQTKSNYIHDILLDELRKRFPFKAQLVNKLIDILYIEREAVYRRLRKEVPFTLLESVAIAKELSLSLDALIGIDLGKKRPFQLQVADYVNPQDIDYQMSEEYVNFLRLVQEDPNATTGTISNTVPLSLASKFSHLYRYIIFKWNYHQEERTPNQTFKQIVLSDRFEELRKANYLESKKIHETHYIFDDLLFESLIQEISYFHSIGLINHSDLQMLKDNLSELIDYLEDIASHGRFPETGNKANIYLSDIRIDTSYSYFNTKNYQLSLIWTLVMNAASTFDEKTFEKIYTLFQSYVRSSTLISTTGEKRRTLFFRKQRELLANL